MTRALLLSMCLALGCASAPAMPAVPPKAVDAPLYRSSLEAVLAHRAELQLADAQVQALSDREKLRQREEADLRLTHGASAKAAPKPSEEKPASMQPSSDLPNNADTPPSSHMGGGHRGGGRRGGARPADAPVPKNLEERLDELDTRAYIEGESALQDSQKDRAREIAEAYREQLYDYQRWIASQPKP